MTCAFAVYIWYTIMDVTARDQDGREIFSREKEFTVNDLYFKGGKRVAMAEWDVTATEHYDLGLKSLQTDRSTFIIPVPYGIKSVVVEAAVRYLYSRDKTLDVDKAVGHVDMTWVYEKPRK